MEMETVCRETAKPLSPTPPHLRTFRLCLLYRMTPVFYTPLMLFYPVDRVAVEHASVPPGSLKSSVSEALDLFYPFAGRLDGWDNLSIDCNDEGALCVETRVDGDLLEFLRDPDIVRCLDRIIPLHGISYAPVRESYVMGVQVNVFRCGGIVLGPSFSHKIIDGATKSAFLNSWAAIARGSPEEAIHAECTAASTLFPGNPVMPSHVPAGSGTLRERSGAACDSPGPTRIEVLAGFIWKQAIKASKAITGTHSPSTAALSVNLRRQIRMPEPETGFPIGNISWKAFADFDSEDVNTTAMTGLIRAAVAEVNEEYFEKLEGTTPALRGGATWDSMRLGEAGIGNVVFKNTVMFMDAPPRGMETLIVLEEKEMDVLETDPEFLKFATPNPTIST